MVMLVLGVSFLGVSFLGISFLGISFLGISSSVGHRNKINQELITNNQEPTTNNQQLIKMILQMLSKKRVDEAVVTANFLQK